MSADWRLGKHHSATVLRTMNIIRTQCSLPIFESFPQRIYSCHFFIIQFKTINITIEFNSVWGIAFWKWNPSLLHAPTYQHLRNRDRMLFCNADKSRFVHLLGSNEWGVSLKDDIMLGAKLRELWLWTEWV